MTEQTESCQTPEIVITIAVNPCHCNESVDSVAVEEISSVQTIPEISPTQIAKPIPVVETPAPEVPPTPIEAPISNLEVMPISDPVTPLVEIMPILVTDSVAEPLILPTPTPVESLPEIIPVLVIEPVAIDPIPATQPVIETITPPIQVPTEVVTTIDPSTSPVTQPVVLIPPEVVVSIVQPPNPIPQEVYPCDCVLTSTLKLAEFANSLRTALSGLLYPSESDFPIEVISSGLSTKMPPGAEVRSLERVFPQSMRQVDPDDQQTGNLERAAIAAKWQAVYSLIKHHSIATVWYYRVRKKNYTHEQMVILLHPQGTAGLRIKLVET